MNKENYPGFVLRNAAGLWFLLDMSKPSVPFKKPLVLNEAGASVWTKIQSGQTLDAISETVSLECGIPRNEADADISAFCEKLKAFGVPLEQ